MKKNKILIVLPQFREIGGIQSSLNNLLFILENEYELDLCIMDNVIPESKVIPKSVNIIKGSKFLEYASISYADGKKKFNKKALFEFIACKIIAKVLGMKNTIGLVSLFFKINNNYDYAISYTNDIYINNKMVGGGSNKIVEKSVNATKKISWIHSEPQREGLTYKISKRTYKNFDNIVNVSYACKEMFDNIIPLYKNKSTVIYNTFMKQEIIDKSNESIGELFSDDFFNIVTVARINNHQKKINRVIETSEYLIKRGVNNFKWYVIGDGEDLKELQKEVENKKLLNHVFFLGRHANPFPYMKQADITVITSDCEAYPMVSKESMIIGTPVLTTKYPSANEVVTTGENGLITDFTANDIGENIIKCINDNTTLNKMKQYLEKNDITNSQALKQFGAIVK